MYLTKFLANFQSFKSSLSNFRYNFDFGTNVLTYDFTAIYTTNNKDIYVGLDKVAFAFNNESDYRKYLDNRSLTFPSADIKKLEKFLPKVVYNGKTTDNKFVVIFHSLFFLLFRFWFWN